MYVPPIFIVSHILTQKVREPYRLIIMFDCNTDSIEEHEDNDKPVEPLGLDRVPHPEPEPLLGPPEADAGPLVLDPRLEVPSPRETYKECYC